MSARTQRKKRFELGRPSARHPRQFHFLKEWPHHYPKDDVAQQQAGSEHRGRLDRDMLEDRLDKAHLELRAGGVKLGLAARNAWSYGSTNGGQGPRQTTLIVLYQYGRTSAAPCGRCAAAVVLLAVGNLPGTPPCFIICLTMFAYLDRQPTVLYEWSPDCTAANKGGGGGKG